MRGGTGTVNEVSGRTLCLCVHVFLHVAWMTQSFGGPVVMDCAGLSSQFDGCAEASCSKEALLAYSYEQVSIHITAGNTLKAPFSIYCQIFSFNYRL